MATKVRQFFYTNELVKPLDVSYRMLQYWDKSGFVSPSMNTGHRRKYSVRDVVKLKILVEMHKRGRSIYSLRDVASALDQSLAKAWDFRLLIFFGTVEGNGLFFESPTETHVMGFPGGFFVDIGNFISSLCLMCGVECS